MVSAGGVGWWGWWGGVVVLAGGVGLVVLAGGVGLVVLGGVGGGGRQAEAKRAWWEAHRIPRTDLVDEL